MHDDDVDRRREREAVRRQLDGATRLTAPVELSADGLTLPATVDIVVVHTGQIATAMVAFALGDPIPEEELASWAEAVAELQAEAVER